MKALTGVLALSLGLLSVPATAAPITYNWSGTVDRVDAGFDPGVSLGQTIGISLTLDGAFGDDDASPGRGSFNATPATLPLVLGIDIGGNTGIGAFQTVTVLRNVGGVDSFEISSSTPHTGLGFDILFQTSHAGVLASDALPLAIDPGDFEIATFSVDRFDAFTMFLPSFGGTIGAATVPEPGSLALLSSGLLGLALLRRRRKKQPGLRPNAGGGPGHCPHASTNIAGQIPAARSPRQWDTTTRPSHIGGSGYRR